MAPTKETTRTLKSLISRDDKPDTFATMPQWLGVVIALILCVVIAAAILFFVKTAAGACGFAPAWFGWKGLVTRGTESTSDRAWHGSSSLGALALAMPKLRPPPPAYIYPPSYTPPMPPSEMQPMAVSLERGGAAPSTQGHSLP